ncbi:MAG: c-type cytochrome [Kiritimatiellae bacterium]|nr:c-type cytochrome [Kiritimatiellia bacterium]
MVKFFLFCLLVNVVVHVDAGPETVGSPPDVQLPSGAAFLFDGTSSAMWDGAWSVKNGAMLSTPGLIATRQSFANYELHLDFAMPDNGAERANLLLNGAHEIPLRAKPGRWHSLDITFEHLKGKAPMASVWLNGKAIETDKVFKGVATTASAKGDASDATPVTAIAYAGLPGEGGPIAIVSQVAGVRIANVWIRPLADVAAAGLIGNWSEASLDRGAKIYAGLCVTCHGTPVKEGSLPTALKFHEGAFKNGNDPMGMYKTLSLGFGQMAPQAWMTPEQKLDVIHYIREAMVRGSNDTQYFEITPAYLVNLPRAARVPTMVPPPVEEGKAYTRMNYGASLNWTLQVDAGNIVQKGIITRLDEGLGGIVNGSAWSIFDHDTLQMAAVWSGADFVDWRGIAFDGSHGSHTSLKGDRLFANAQGPGWAHPETGSWDDPRVKGRDGRLFGPLPRDWAHYKGLYKHGNNTVVSYTVGKAKVLEMAGVEIANAKRVTTRTLNIDGAEKDLVMRVAPSSVNVVLAAGSNAKLATLGASTVLKIPAMRGLQRIKLYIASLDPAELAAHAASAAPAHALSAFIGGGPRQWVQTVTTKIQKSEDNAAYVVDTLTVPFKNPFNSWMRLSGFDFYPDGKTAIVSTWQGDVWKVDGVDQDEGELVWTRIASGLFQPLGVKIVDDRIYLGCRDQIVRLNDLNGDGETDFYESFNNDHQVTEHFHEFAMGLQADKQGNFYYAKSARHAKTALVPHHGTLLKVSKDGSSTEILATGFRAANGVCINPDGSFFVTDQEGHWTPKNRINWVTAGKKFYGNYMGYHDVKTKDDSAMEKPMIWLTNRFNRSPAELMWANSKRWGPLNGQLLELSYGMGHIFLNLYETVQGQMQGGQVRLPIPEFDTGVMRGRINPANGQLYAAGMFAWAGNKHAPGNFHRVRYTGQPVHVPTALRAVKSGLEIDFPVSLDADSVSPDAIEVKSWHIVRGPNYGSGHKDEQELVISATTLSKDGKTLHLTIPDIAPTRCMSIKAKPRTTDGHTFAFEINNTIHYLR